MHDKIERSPVSVGAADPSGPSPVSFPAREINQSAVDTWFNEEWKKQVLNAESAVEAYKLVKSVQQGEISAVGKRDYDLISDTCAKLNGLIAPYTDERVSETDFVVSVETVRKANALIDSLDEIEKAAYDKTSMTILAGNIRNANTVSMLCFAITNHFWRKCGGKSTYPEWGEAYLLHQICGGVDSIEKLQRILRGEIMRIANLAAKGFHSSSPFEEHITLPAEFSK